MNRVFLGYESKSTHSTHPPTRAREVRGHGKPRTRSKREARKCAKYASAYTCARGAHRHPRRPDNQPGPTLPGGDRDHARRDSRSRRRFQRGHVGYGRTSAVVVLDGQPGFWPVAHERTFQSAEICTRTGCSGSSARTSSAGAGSLVAAGASTLTVWLSSSALNSLLSLRFWRSRRSCSGRRRR